MPTIARPISSDDVLRFFPAALFVTSRRPASIMLSAFSKLPVVLITKKHKNRIQYTSELAVDLYARAMAKVTRAMPPVGYVTQSSMSFIPSHASKMDNNG